MGLNPLEDPLVVFPIVRLGQWAIGKGLDAHDLTELEGAPLFRLAPSKTTVLRWRLVGWVVFGFTWLTMVLVTLLRKQPPSSRPGGRGVSQ